jgi:1-aminocyclopropane-1-carboxylate deaminase/D-cysteine desulfhydrase-like pyridoxal-dependent ACC family enzyme
MNLLVTLILTQDFWGYLQRDDLSGMQLSGNKVRKLEFLMADVVAQGADCVITVGGIQSNHCRATAVATKHLNLDCYLILRISKVIPVC